MGQVKEAEPHLRRALELNPNDVYNHLELVRNLEAQERFDEAITLLAKSVGFMLHYNRKDDASLLGNYSQSIKTRRAGRQ
jgi:tetratricopeptide (TPR) repeat protein